MTYCHTVPLSDYEICTLYFSYFSLNPNIVLRLKYIIHTILFPLSLFVFKGSF